MKVILFIFLFITYPCFSQQVILDENYVSRIDSIITLTPIHTIESSGIINKKKKNSNKVFAEGGFSFTIYKFQDESKILKANYIENLEYKNLFSDEIYAQFFYKENKLCYLKLEINRTEKNKVEQKQNFEFSQNELDDYKEIKNIFLINLRKWINAKNIDILEYLKLN